MSDRSRDHEYHADKPSMPSVVRDPEAGEATPCHHHPEGLTCTCRVKVLRTGQNRNLAAIAATVIILSVSVPIDAQSEAHCTARAELGTVCTVLDF